MSDHNEHRQVGTLMVVVLCLGAAVAGTAAFTNPSAGRWMGLAIALGCGVLAWLFSSLTVIVNGDELQWYFGPGGNTEWLAPTSPTSASCATAS